MAYFLSSDVCGEIRSRVLDWPSILNALSRRVNPLMGTLLGRMQYYWVTAQCEYSTNVMFKTPFDLKETVSKTH